MLPRDLGRIPTREVQRMTRFASEALTTDKSAKTEQSQVR